MKPIIKYEPRTPKNTTNVFSALSWDADPSPLSLSSRLARRIHTKMSREYYTEREGRSIIAVGIFFRFGEVSSNTGQKERYCLLGSSIQGERTANIDLAYISGQYGTDIFRCLRRCLNGVTPNIRPGPSSLHFLLAIHIGANKVFVHVP